MAWLLAVPVHKGIANSAENRSRLALMEGRPPPLPKVEACGYLIDYLFEVGPVQSNGMGAMVVSFEELQAWQRLCQHTLEPWEVLTLRSMSQAFANEAQTASEPNAPPPWIELPSDEKRRDIAKRARAALRD